MKPFNLQEIIKERCNREAVVDWSKQQPIPIPKVKMPEVIDCKPGWVNFFKGVLLEFRL